MPSANRKKKIVANRSRSGPSKEPARSCAGPEIARPTRNAPTAADTSTSWASPPTSSTRPNTVSTMTSSDSEWISRLMNGPKRIANTMISNTTPSATLTEISPVATPVPARSTPTIGRYTAITRSSSTSTDSTVVVSRLPSRSRSFSSFEISPEDEM